MLSNRMAASSAGGCALAKKTQFSVSFFRSSVFVVACFLSAQASALEVEQQSLFVGKVGGYRSYRIPAMVVTDKETVLAFCEARKNSVADHGDIDLVVRRSFDHGKTWQPMELVYEEGGSEPITIGNPCPIVATDGTIHLLFCRNNQAAFVMKSHDDGKTFSKPVEITESLRSFRFPFKRIGTGPVHGIQMASGRLVVPLWINDQIGQEYRSATAYSDDGGATWKAGGIVPPEVRGLNECSVVELAGGKLLMNMRNRQAKCRAMATSEDWGVTWSAPCLTTDLVDPECQGAMLGLGAARGGRVLFSNPAASKRMQMTVRASDDGGKTWSVMCVLREGPAAYSDLAVAGDGAVVCLYEGGVKTSNEKIFLARWKLE
jgi:sialidase-1